jgi:hypothetical protein
MFDPGGDLDHVSEFRVLKCVERLEKLDRLNVRRVDHSLDWWQ